MDYLIFGVFVINQLDRVSIYLNAYQDHMVKTIGESVYFLSNTDTSTAPIPTLVGLITKSYIGCFAPVEGKKNDALVRQDKLHHAVVLFILYFALE